MGTPEGKPAPYAPETVKADPDFSKTTPKKETPPNPETAKTEKPLPSAPTSESRSKSAKGTSSRKPSVKEEIREITAAQKSRQEAETPTRDERQADKLRGNSSTAHKQPPSGGRIKSKKSKESFPIKSQDKNYGSR
jgi:hypothetical protein